jgi:hypothetical protein
MIATLTSSDFKVKIAQIKADRKLQWIGMGIGIPLLVLFGGLFSVWNHPNTGGPMIVGSIMAILFLVFEYRKRVQLLANELGVCCSGCGESLVHVSTITPRFPVGMCSVCGSDTISDLAGGATNFTLLIERNSFSKGFYKSLGEESAKICLVAVKCFIGAMAAVAGLVLATSILLSFLRALVNSIFNNG